MSGLEDLGQEAMQQAENFLRDSGYLFIMNPYKMVDQTKKYTWAECMTIDIKDIMNFGVKGVLLLDNWKNSKGATLEVILFLALGKPIFNIKGENITMDLLMFEMQPDFIHEKFLQMVNTHQ